MAYHELRKGFFFAFWSVLIEVFFTKRLYPKGSMYGMFAYIWVNFMEHVGKYTIHGFYGYDWVSCHTMDGVSVSLVGSSRHLKTIMNQFINRTKCGISTTSYNIYSPKNIWRNSNSLMTIFHLTSTILGIYRLRLKHFKKKIGFHLRI